MEPNLRPHTGKTVLLAEEDDDTREELASELRHDGYHVVAVEDGLELCDYLELARFSDGRVPNPDLIVSDVELAGYDGIELCRMLAGDEDTAPFILLAPGDDPESWENAERAGAAHVIDKPVDVPQFLDAVATFTEAP